MTFIPRLPPRPARAELRQRFYGSSAPSAVAVLTPFARVYEAMPGDPPPQGSSAWWPAKWEGRAMTARVPQGTPALDAVTCLEPDTAILWIGLAGSTGVLRVGHRAYAAGALSADAELFDAGIPSPVVAERAVVASVGSIAESHQRREELRSSCDCVDMETGHLYALGARQGRRVASLLVISDHLFDSPVARTPPDLVLRSLDAITRDLAQGMEAAHAFQVTH